MVQLPIQPKKQDNKKSSGGGWWWQCGRGELGCTKFEKDG